MFGEVGSYFAQLSTVLIVIDDPVAGPTTTGNDISLREVYLDGLQKQFIASPVQWLNTQDMTQTQMEQEVLNMVNNYSIEVCHRNKNLDLTNFI